MLLTKQGSLFERFLGVMTDNSQLEDKFYPLKTCQPIYVFFAAIIASVGGVLFGYDIGITSGALLQLKDDFHLTFFEQEMVVSGVLVGALFASFFGGNIVDRWGRKVGIGFSCCLFVVGALVLSFSVNFIMLIVGRFIVGVAVSLSVTSECTYISEISPPSHRGMMVSLNEVGITVGFLLAYLINYIFIKTHHGWKYMFGAASILALIQGVGVTFMPNSHHYLLVKGETDKARKVLISLRNSNNVEEELEAIISSIEEQKNRSYVDLFTSSNNMRGRMLLGMALVFLQQFSGNANVLYYAPTVFQHFGYDTNTSAMLVTVGLGVVKVFATTVTLLIVDKVGRKSLLLVGCLLMATSIMVLGIVGTVTEFNTRHGESPAIIIHNQSTIIKNTVMNIRINESLETPNMKSERRESFDINSVNRTENLSEQINWTGTPVLIPDAQSYNLSEHNILFFEENRNEPLSSTTHLQDKTNFYDVQNAETKRILLLQTIQNNNLTNDFETKLPNTTDSFTEAENIQVSLATKLCSVVSLMVFVCAYGMSYGPVTWLVLSEIFPGALRGRAFSVATCINWGSNIIVSVTFLDVLNAIGIGPTFIGYGLISYGAAVFIFLCVPETKSKTLAEIDVLLNKGLQRKNIKICTYFLNHQKYSIKETSFDMKTKNGEH